MTAYGTRAHSSRTWGFIAWLSSNNSVINRGDKIWSPPPFFSLFKPLLFHGLSISSLWLGRCHSGFRTFFCIWGSQVRNCLQILCRLSSRRVAFDSEARLTRLAQPQRVLRTAGPSSSGSHLASATWSWTVSYSGLPSLFPYKITFL